MVRILDMFREQFYFPEIKKSFVIVDKDWINL